jgi:hypothetical protein
MRGAARAKRTSDVQQPDRHTGERLIIKPYNWIWLCGGVIALSVIIGICLACSGVYFLPQAFDSSAARQNAQRYLIAISTADPVAVRQQCQQIEQAIISKEIAGWDGTEIRDVQFRPLVRTNSLEGVERMFEVTFASPSRSGQLAATPVTDVLVVPRSDLVDDTIARDLLGLVR